MGKVYILTPVARTGGIEAIFQLAHALGAMGREALLLPGTISLDAGRRLHADGPADFALTYPEYAVRCAVEAQLAPQDSVVIPEVFLRHYEGLRRLACRRYLWWLSVDNAFAGDIGTPGDHPFFAGGASRDFVHLYQSFYAAAFLHGKGVAEAHELKCYVNDTYRAAARPGAPRDRTVLFNPSKDDVFWRALAAQCPHLQFQPLRGLSAQGMRDAFATARAYIDFGSHPGMDRIPREAAMNGLVVVTGLRGAAGNLVDVPIHRDFKFSDADVHSGRCAKALSAFVEDHAAALARQDAYRRWVAGQKDAFTLAVRAVWGPA